MIELYASYMALHTHSLVYGDCNLVIEIGYFRGLLITIEFGYARPQFASPFSRSVNSIQNKTTVTTHEPSRCEDGVPP